MKVYSLLQFVDYEGYDLKGVYASLEDLRAAEAKLEHDKYSSFYYVESELGQSVETYDAISLEV